MEVVVASFILICILLLVIFVIRVPIIIAKNRGISGSELSTITLLSWISLLCGLTWLIALILALVWKPNNWVDKAPKTGLDDLQALEKLYNLKEKGVITDSEYEAQKKLIFK